MYNKVFMNKVKKDNDFFNKKKYLVFIIIKLKEWFKVIYVLFYFN